jgi:hypothetical protein
VTSAYAYFHSHYMGDSGTGGAEVPPEVLELMLMEKFNWTPMEIDAIPIRKLRTMLTVLNQRRVTEVQTAEIKEKVEQEKIKNRRTRQKR